MTRPRRLPPPRKSDVGEGRLLKLGIAEAIVQSACRGLEQEYGIGPERARRLLMAAIAVLDQVD